MKVVLIVVLLAAGLGIVGYLVAEEWLGDQNTTAPRGHRQTTADARSPAHAGMARPGHRPPTGGHGGREPSPAGSAKKPGTAHPRTNSTSQGKRRRKPGRTDGHPHRDAGAGARDTGARLGGLQRKISRPRVPENDGTPRRAP